MSLEPFAKLDAAPEPEPRRRALKTRQKEVLLINAAGAGAWLFVCLMAAADLLAPIGAIFAMLAIAALWGINLLHATRLR